MRSSQCGGGTHARQQGTTAEGRSHGVGSSHGWRVTMGNQSVADAHCEVLSAVNIGFLISPAPPISAGLRRNGITIANLAASFQPGPVLSTQPSRLFGTIAVCNLSSSLFRAENGTYAPYSSGRAFRKEKVGFKSHFEVMIRRNACRFRHVAAVLASEMLFRRCHCRTRMSSRSTSTKRRGAACRSHLRWLPRPMVRLHVYFWYVLALSFLWRCGSFIALWRE